MVMVTWFRVHPAHEAPETVLSEERWSSRAWVGELTRRCGMCHGEGNTVCRDASCRLCDGTGYTESGRPCVDRCAACDGAGEVEDVRRGVSVCGSVAALRAYLAGRDWTREGVVLEMEGTRSEDEDHDAADGAVLVLPSRIVAVHPLSILEAES